MTMKCSMKDLSSLPCHPDRSLRPRQWFAVAVSITLCLARPGDLLKVRAHHVDQNEVSSMVDESLTSVDWLAGRLPWPPPFSLATSAHRACLWVACVRKRGLRCDIYRLSLFAMMRPTLPSFIVLGRKQKRCLRPEKMS
jgi:hypothetical protein